MTRIFAIKKSTWIAFFVSILASFLMAAVTHAQSNEEEVAAKYGVKFPVAELGNCSNIAECRNFCEDPVNQTTCTDFAKKKGFYKEQEVVSTRKTEIVEAAKKQLGCDSEDSCRSFCSDLANFDKCSAFAKSRGLSGGQVEDVAKAKIIDKAKEILGCDSQGSCSDFCSKEENRQKCSQFAKETGLRGGEQRVGPGGCSSEETCKAFCSDPQNFQVCRGFSESAGRQFSGPGGCNSEESCRSYCKNNEEKCRNFGEQRGEGERYNPQEMCSRTPNCRWEENTCKCGFYEGGRLDNGRNSEEYAKFCRENPERCRPAPGASPSSYEKGCTPGQYWDGSKCAVGKNEGPGWSDSAAREKKWCQPPSGGCGADSFWDYSYCSCNKRSGGSSGTTTSGGSGSTTSGGSENIYSGGHPGGPGAPFPGKSSSGGGAYGGGYDASGKYVGGSYGGYDSAGNYVGTGSQGGSAPAPAPQPPQQSQPAPQPEQQSQPAPQPEQQSQPAPAPQEPVPAPAAPAPAEPAPASEPAPAVQGIAAVRSLLDQILDLFR